MARASAVHAPLDSRRGAICRARWRRWVSRLEDELQSLLISRQTFTRVADIVHSNPRIQTPYHFHVWLVHNYVFALSVRIRKLMDPGKRKRIRKLMDPGKRKGKESVSLLRLLKEIEDSPGAITRRSFLRQSRGEIRRAMGKEFDHIAGSGEPSLPAWVPREDRERVEQAHRRIRRWVNKRFAHLDQRNLSLRPPTLDEMNDVVDLLAHTFLKYRLLLKRGSYRLDPARIKHPVRRYDLSSILPVLQDDWTSVLEHPWIAVAPDDCRGDCVSDPDDVKMPWTNHPTFYRIAHEHYMLVKRLMAQRDARPARDREGVDFHCWKNAEIQRAAMVTVVFCALALEALINHYGIESFSRSFFSKHLDKLSPPTKWLIIPRLAIGRQLDTDGQAYELLCRLFKLRDRLVHFKSHRKDPTQTPEDELWVSENQAGEAIRTVESLGGELARLDGSVDTDWLGEALSDPYV
jgi:hypothetical protein